MSANLDELGARMADHALAAEVEEMREKLGVLSTLADKDALEELSESMRSAASKEAVEALQRDVLVAQAGLKTMETSNNARFELKADQKLLRELDAEIKRLNRGLDEKLGVHQAEKLLEHKADYTAMQKLTSHSQSEGAELHNLKERLGAAEGMLSTARRDASEAAEHARASAGALNQLQSATDKHWQITRSSREEQAQLVKAVRALLLDAELRVNAEAAAQAAGGNVTTQARLSPVPISAEYGSHGWTSPSAQHAATKSLPRVAVASSNVGASGAATGSTSPCCSPTKKPPLSTAPWNGDVDVLTRRRWLLAGASLGPEAQGMEGSLTLPNALALPGGDVNVSRPPPPQPPTHPSGAQTHRAGGERTRTRIGGDNPYPSLVPIG